MKSKPQKLGGWASVKSLKKGDFFTLSETSKEVYVRGEYDRELQKYDCGVFSDISRNRYFPAKKLVYVDFEF